MGMERRIHDFIPEVKDLYTITSDGEVFSDNSGKMKTRNKGKTKYQIINFMREDGAKKTFRLHRLVMMAFEPREDIDTLEVNHKDGDKTNNKLDNLEWCSPSENQIHAYQVGLQHARRGELSNFSKLTEEEIKEIFQMRKQGMLQREIADKIGCTRSNISYILSNKTWQV